MFLAPSFFPVLIERLAMEDYGDYFDAKIMTGISKGIAGSSNYPENITNGLEAIFSDKKINPNFRKEIIRFFSTPTPEK